MVVQALGITRTAVLPGFMYEVVEKPCCQFFSKVYCMFSENFRIDPQRASIVLDVIFRIYYFEVILVKSLLLEPIRPAALHAKGSWPVGQVLNRSPIEVVAASADLGTTTAVTDDTESAIEAFLYANCTPHTALVETSPKNNLKIRNCRQALYIKPSIISRLWCGIRTKCLTLSSHPHRTMAGLKKEIAF